MTATPKTRALLRPGRAAALALGLLALAACERHAPQNRPPEPGDRAVATVGDQTVWASDVKREAVAQGLIGEGEPLDISSLTFHQVLDEVIDQKLLAAEAIRRKFDDEPLVKRRLAAARERILGDALIEAEVEHAVSDSAIQGLYDEQVRLSKQTDEFHARQIVSASQADADAVRKALGGGAPFDALAMQRSTDAATRFNGGDLGYVAADAMPQAYASALAGAKPGDIVGPFKADAGWVVLKLEDRRPEKPLSMEQARPQIVRFLHFSEVRDVLGRLRQKTPTKLLIGPAQDVPGAPREPASAPAGPAASATPAAASAAAANPTEKTP
ncbi:MAG: peptidylprolyl isomerase [Caulobacteraceae bacterium]|nr:peptidylprolyl isomerase [Caulobacteraceae bacterium]